jgi:phospholipid-transporting ATPase
MYSREGLRTLLLA